MNKVEPRAKRSPTWDQYAGMLEDLRDYFRRYGGVKALLTSPYTLVATFVTVVCWGSWRSANWPDLALSVLPALLGFTLAAYALLLAFGDERFRAFLAEQQAEATGTAVPEDNALLGISAIFLHFIVVQVVAILLAIVAISHPLSAFGGRAAAHNGVLHALRNVYAFLGFYSFVLSLALALAAGLDIFHATRWYVLFKAVDVKNRRAQEDGD